MRSLLLACAAPLLLVLALFMGAPAANAADYPLPSSGNGTVDQSSVEQGGCVNFTGDGFKPGSTVTITQDGADAGTATADQNGTFSKEVCFASDARPGKHVLIASGIGANGAARLVTVTVNVLGVQAGVTAPQGGGGGLPFTGSDVRDMTLLGLGLTGAGVLLVLRGRRDQRARRQARLSA